MKLFLQKFSLLFLTALLAANVWAQTETSAEDQKVFVTNEATINTENLEYSPAFYEDGIVFISSKHPSKKFKVKDSRINKNIMSIFLAKRSESGLLQVPTPFAKEIMTTVHEGPVTFDRTADFLFFTRNNYKNGKRRRAKDGIIKLQIFSAEKVRDTWSNVKQLPFNDKESNACHPAISVEGDMLYFSSDRPGGHGGMDIWVSRRLGDEWGEPVNLGPEVNTEGEEVFPFVHADGSLYFASNSHVGFGGLDMFSTKKVGDSWSKPNNLNPPFNSENDDFGFIIDRDKKNGYFSSNRVGGFGEDDIFSFYVTGNLDGENSKPRSEHLLSLVVSDFESAEMIEGARITHASLDDLSIAQAIAGQSEEGLATLSDSDKELLVRVPLEENGTVGTSDNWGKYPVTILNGKHIFIIEKEGYQKRQIILDTEDAGEELFVSLEKQGSNSSTGGTVVAVSTTTTTGPNGETIVTTTNSDGSITTTTTKTNGEVVTTTTFTNGAYSTITNKIDGVTIIAISNPDGSVTTTTIALDGTETSTTSYPTIVDNGTGNGTFPSKIEEGTVFQLPNIYYNFNDASIRPDATYDLEALASFLNQYQDIEIELSSHTDSRGGTRYNKRLSQKRAESAVRYLVSQGISSSRMAAVGYGESELRNRCSDGVSCNEDEHQFNRRTQVKITKMTNEINIQFINSEPSYSDSGSGSFDEGGSTTSGSISTNTVSSSYEGDFQVVAGVYAVYDNAETKVNRLYKLGYNDAQIINMDGSEKFTILVKTCNDKAEAKRIVKDLKRKKIRSFVKS